MFIVTSLVLDEKDTGHGFVPSSPPFEIARHLSASREAESKAGAPLASGSRADIEHVRNSF
jgi:hypothetical protein